MEKQIVGFLNWVYPQIINSNRILDYKPSSYCGTPWLRNLHLHQLILCLAVPKGGKTHLKLPGIKKFKFIFHGRLDHGSFTWNGCSSPARAAHGFVKKKRFPARDLQKTTIATCYLQIRSSLWFQHVSGGSTTDPPQSSLHEKDLNIFDTTKQIGPLLARIMSWLNHIKSSFMI